MALGSNLHILFVDDDEAVVGTTVQTLSKQGHVVTSRTTSLDALKLFSEQPNDFDLAILDPTMAGISGFELAQRFRRVQPGFPVILYGGHIETALSAEAQKAGIHCCGKPATTDELQTVIGEALKKIS